MTEKDKAQEQGKVVEKYEWPTDYETLVEECYNEDGVEKEDD